MSTAIVTITIGATYEQIAKQTHPTIKAYAQKIGAEFIVIDRPKIATTTSHFEKFQISSLLNKYSRIIFIDTDIIVRDDCPSLFDVVPEGKLGAYNEGAIMERESAMQSVSAAYDIPLKFWNGKYFNTGVMVISRKHKDLFIKPEKEIYNYYEQSYLNLQIMHREISTFDLHHDFNRMHALDKKTGIHRLRSYIVHYAGILNGLDKIIPHDLSIWKSGRWKEFKQHVLVNVGAGRLGDNICAEPVVRHIIENYEDKALITVASTDPQIFKHLEKRAMVTSIENFAPEFDTPYLMINTSPDEREPIRKYLDGTHMSGVDFASLVSIKRVLPDGSRRITLPVTAAGVSEVIEVAGNPPMNMVLVHPGVSWKSKTFPKAYWDDVIARLLKEKFEVGVIGSTMSMGRGYADVDVTGATDFRDLLSLEGLFALISMAKVLVTNDSAPLHVACAFDNSIVLIPTCKHPDLLLSSRLRGGKYHKAVALYNKLCSPLVLEDYGVAIAEAEAGECLPGVADVVSAVSQVI